MQGQNLGLGGSTGLNPAILQLLLGSQRPPGGSPGASPYAQGMPQGGPPMGSGQPMAPTSYPAQLPGAGAGPPTLPSAGMQPGGMRPPMGPQGQAGPQSQPSNLLQQILGNPNSLAMLMRSMGGGAPAGLGVGVGSTPNYPGT